MITVNDAAACLLLDPAICLKTFVMRLPSEMAGSRCRHLMRLRQRDLSTLKSGRSERCSTPSKTAYCQPAAPGPADTSSACRLDEFATRHPSTTALTR